MAPGVLERHASVAGSSEGPARVAPDVRRRRRHRLLVWSASLPPGLPGRVVAGEEAGDPLDVLDEVGGYVLPDAVAAR